MLKERYVLEAEETISSPFPDGYYTGKKYIHHGEKFAVVSGNINEAKVYSSKLRAIKGCEIGFSNYIFRVVKIED